MKKVLGYAKAVVTDFTCGNEKAQANFETKRTKKEKT